MTVYITIPEMEGKLQTEQDLTRHIGQSCWLMAILTSQSCWLLPFIGNYAHCIWSENICNVWNSTVFQFSDCPWQFDLWSYQALQSGVEWYGRGCGCGRGVVNRPDSHTLRLRQNDRHFADGIFKLNFLCENCCILFEILQAFVPKGPIIHMLILVQW